MMWLDVEYLSGSGQPFFTAEDVRSFRTMGLEPSTWFSLLVCLCYLMCEKWFSDQASWFQRPI
jgi:hypothetical protein